jgi:hypothetical protein
VALAIDGVALRVGDATHTSEGQNLIGGCVIDENLLRMAKELSELQELTLSPNRVLLQATGDLEAVEKRSRLLSAKVADLWPWRGDLLASVGIDRMVTFLESAPRGLFLPQYRAYWRAIARTPIDESIRTRLVNVITSLLANGPSQHLELATPIAARIWDAEFEEAARVGTSSPDPDVRSAASRFVFRSRRLVEGANPDPLPPPPGSSHERTRFAATRLMTLVDAHVTPALRTAWEFRPPADNAAIDELRSLVDPFPLPSSLESWLRTANGVANAQHWPGFVLGPYYSVDHIIESWDLSHDYSMPRGLMALGYSSHTWLCIELVAHREAAIVEFGIGDCRVLAPSLPTFLEAVNDCIEERWFDRWLDAGSWRGDQIRLEYDAIWQKRCEVEGWNSAPHPHEAWMDKHDYPPEWSTPVPGIAEL